MATISTTQAIWLTDVLHDEQSAGYLSGVDLRGFSALNLEQEQYRRIVYLYYKKRYDELQDYLWQLGLPKLNN